MVLYWYKNLFAILGDLVDEIHIQHSDWVSQVWRYYKEELYNVELQWLVGPIPIKYVIHII